MADLLKIVGTLCKRQELSTASPSWLFLPGQDADLLLHEATLEDGMDEEAVIKKHRWERKKNMVLSILCRLKFLKFLLNTAQEITSRMPGVSVKTKLTD